MAYSMQLAVHLSECSDKFLILDIQSSNKPDITSGLKINHQREYYVEQI